MTYKLVFAPTALKEWKKLASSIREQFKKKLTERLENPHVPSAKLRGFNAAYKIKLKMVGYRLVYKVIDCQLIVMVLVVGKRENNNVYKKLYSRL